VVSYFRDAEMKIGRVIVTFMDSFEIIVLFSYNSMKKHDLHILVFGNILYRTRNGRLNLTWLLV